MDSEDSRDGKGDGRSSSSSSSSGSPSRRSSSSERCGKYKQPPKTPPRSPPLPKSNGPHSPSPYSRSRSTSPKHRHSSENLSDNHSNINSPENSISRSLGPKSFSEASDQGSPYLSAPQSPVAGPKTPQSPLSSAQSPDNRSRPISPEHNSNPASPSRRTLSPVPQSKSIRNSPQKSPGHSSHSSPSNKNDWSPKENWRGRSRSKSYGNKDKSRSRDRSQSYSSRSSRGSTYNKRRSTKEPATEEISDGEMESDQDPKSPAKSVGSDKIDSKEDGQLNISHEDLSDVSDLDSMGPDETTKESKSMSPPLSPCNDIKSNSPNAQQSPKSDSEKCAENQKVTQEMTSNNEEGEEQLDFEAEEGECIETPTEKTNGQNVIVVSEEKEQIVIKPAPVSRGSSLEEGEVSDDGEKRPEENEPRPVCRFYSRGACTWGVSCRFLHPGVTDKGNYNMFDVVRGVPAHATPMVYTPREPAPPESAWERGLRTAKEMLRIANKRKEQDMDFEEKKLHLSLGGVVHDPDAELAYAAAAVGASPPAVHHELPPPPREPEPFRHAGPFGPMYRPPRFMPGRPVVEERERERYYERAERPYERDRGFERTPAYDERAAAADDVSYQKRRARTTREVTVQRAEVVQRREPRESARGGEEWADPWMRGSSATRRRRHASSEESYSSSSSSNSSSHSSRSPSARRKRRASSSSRLRLSPSVIVRERRMATARATAMNPPAPRRRAPSPAAARQHSANPPPPASHRHKDDVDVYGRRKGTGRDKKRYSRSSSSDSSSSSSESESDSRSSTSSGSSSEAARRGRHARLLNAAARPRSNLKVSGGLANAVSTVSSKKEVLAEKDTAGKKRSATSPINSGVPAKKSVSRREELLKQLKAVEDAIARKRSKI